MSGPPDQNVMRYIADLERQLSEAEERGFRRAVEALRDSKRYHEWDTANGIGPAGARSYVAVHLREVCADYLDWLSAPAEQT